MDTYKVVGIQLTRKLSSLYYSPMGYWKGIVAIKTLTTKAKVSENIAAKDLLKNIGHLAYRSYHPRDAFRDLNSTYRGRTEFTRPT